MWAWARLQASKGCSAVYYYSFQMQPPFPRDSVYAGCGASHFAELWCVFNHLSQAPWDWKQRDRALSEDMLRCRTNFAKFGDPNGHGLAPWPTFSGASGKVLYFGGPLAADGVANLESLSVLDGVYTAVRGRPFGEQ
jgi:para-nitrobenzyl esterase